MIRQWLRQWLGVPAVGHTDILDLNLRADQNFRLIDDINLRMGHLAKRMDEAEHLLKRIHDHMPKV